MTWDARVDSPDSVLTKVAIRVSAGFSLATRHETSFCPLPRARRPVNPQTALKTTLYRGTREPSIGCRVYSRSPAVVIIISSNDPPSVPTSSLRSRPADEASIGQNKNRRKRRQIPREAGQLRLQLTPRRIKWQCPLRVRGCQRPTGESLLRVGRAVPLRRRPGDGGRETRPSRCGPCRPADGANGAARWYMIGWPFALGLGYMSESLTVLT